MKRTTNILILLALVGMVSSCQKDDFAEEFERVDASPEMKSTDTEVIDNYNETVPDSDPADILDVDIKLVKEVSDGDDEADSGDDSKTSN